MRVLIDIAHPGHVHLFKNVYAELVKNGHAVFVSTRDIPVALHLLKFYNIPFYNIGGKRNSIFGKAITTLQQDAALLIFVKQKAIDIGVSSHIVLSHVAKVSSMKSLIFDDDDDIVEPLVVKYGHSFADIILSPDSIVRKNAKNIGYCGMHELAYLHPNRFQADENVLNELGIQQGEKYFILRFVAFKAHHDIGQFGINVEQKQKIIDLLKPYGKIFISSENPIEREFEEYLLSVPPEKIHSLIYFADLFLGDSQTMTSEAAIMGIPALKCNTFAGKLSVPNDLERKYGLCYSYQPAEFEKFYAHIQQLLVKENLKDEWKQKRDVFLKEIIDVTAFFVWFIENFPDSKRIMKDNPDFQNNFK
jgi:uncharacterized protein